MIGDQSPCETIGVRLSQYPPQPVYEGITISIVPENLPAFDSTHNNMVQRPGASIQAFLGMVDWLTAKSSLFNLYNNTRALLSPVLQCIEEIDEHGYVYYMLSFSLVNKYSSGSSNHQSFFSPYRP